MTATHKAHVAHATPAPTPQQPHPGPNNLLVGYLILCALGAVMVVFAWRVFWGVMAWAGNQQRQRGTVDGE